MALECVAPQGIGVHHSGLLPILKELVEILFQEQLLKVWSFLFSFLDAVLRATASRITSYS